MFKSDRYAASAPAGGELRLRQVFGFVVAALDIEIWASQFNGLQRHFVRKDQRIQVQLAQLHDLLAY